MSGSNGHDAVLTGGPGDGTHVRADDVAVVELNIDGMVHRYIRTTQQRDDGGRSYAVYNYDGEIDPDGARSGVETR